MIFPVWVWIIAKYSYYLQGTKFWWRFCIWKNWYWPSWKRCHHKRFISVSLLFFIIKFWCMQYNRYWNLHFLKWHIIATFNSVNSDVYPQYRFLMLCREREHYGILRGKFELLDHINDIIRNFLRWDNVLLVPSS